VWEWCTDWNGDYSATPVTNPSGPATGNTRVLRGGSWNDYCDYLRGAYRCYFNPESYNYNIGFRCISVSSVP